MLATTFRISPLALLTLGVIEMIMSTIFADESFCHVSSSSLIMNVEYLWPPRMSYHELLECFPKSLSTSSKLSSFSNSFRKSTCFWTFSSKSNAEVETSSTSLAYDRLVSPADLTLTPILGQTSYS